ncbi:MAG: hypothetical protein GY711_33820 [bacterium]|nr:hypothetical protein [bacterium]
MRLTTKSGFTYVELTIAIVVMAVGLGMGLMGTLRSTEAFRTSDRRATEDTKVRRALRRMINEIASTGDAVIFPSPTADGSSELNYNRSEGYEAGVVVWGEPRKLHLELEPGEAADGLDNNGNGLIDEGMIVFTLGVNQPDQKRVILCKGVSVLLQGEIDNGLDDNGNGMIDEPGFVLQRMPDSPMVSVFVSLEGVDQNGMRFQRTLSTATRMRN